MTRLISLKSLLAAATGFTALALQGQPAAVLPQGTVEVDGVIDDSWESVEANVIEEALLASPPAESDFSASWKGQWDEDNLYLLFVVEDDTPTEYNPIEFDRTSLNIFEIDPSVLEFITNNLASITRNYWEFDVLQIFIDPDLSAGTDFDGVDDTHLVIPRDIVSPIEFQVDPLDLAGSDAAYFSSYSDGVFVLELSIPMAALSTLTPEVGTQFGMDVLASDQTSDDALDVTELLGWGDAGTGVPETYLVVELGEPLDGGIRDLVPGEVPAALFDSTIVTAEDDTTTTYESSWWGTYMIDIDSLNRNVMDTGFLGYVQFTSISTASSAYFYSYLTEDIVWTNEVYWPAGYGYSYTRGAWLYFSPFNDVTTGSIFIFNYTDGAWETYEIEG
jgi:hypothetical protein